MTTCPRCAEPLASGQAYCVSCGARLADTPRAATTSPVAGWPLRVLAAGVVAVIGAAGAIAATGSDGGGVPVTTAIGGFATAPERPAGEEAVGPSGVGEWPTDEAGWTIALVSLPKTAGRAAALARARAARKRLPQVGVLDSSRYASLHPGYWIVFSGVYSSEAEATSALEDARRASRTAVVRRVVP